MESLRLSLGRFLAGMGYLGLVLTEFKFLDFGFEFENLARRSGFSLMLALILSRKVGSWELALSLSEEMLSFKTFKFLFLLDLRFGCLTRVRNLSADPLTG